MKIEKKFKNVPRLVTDVETTGLNVNRDEIIEISLILISEDTIISSYSSLVRPSDWILENKQKLEKIQEITGITKAELIVAEKKAQVKIKLANWLNQHRNFFQSSMILLWFVAIKKLICLHEIWVFIVS